MVVVYSKFDLIFFFNPLRWSPFFKSFKGLYVASMVHLAFLPSDSIWRDEYYLSDSMSVDDGGATSGAMLLPDAYVLYIHLERVQGLKNPV